MRVKVIRSSCGSVINVGEWDFAAQSFDTGLLDVCGTPIVRVICLNPMPEGSYVDEAEMVVGSGGGLYEAGDHRVLQEGPVEAQST